MLWNTKVTGSVLFNFLVSEDYRFLTYHLSIGLMTIEYRGIMTVL
jgi:hypothetical protein